MISLFIEPIITFGSIFDDEDIGCETDYFSAENHFDFGDFENDLINRNKPSYIYTYVEFSTKLSNSSYITKV